MDTFSVFQNNNQNRKLKQRTLKLNSNNIAKGNFMAKNS